MFIDAVTEALAEENRAWAAVAERVLTDLVDTLISLVGKKVCRICARIAPLPKFLTETSLVIRLWRSGR